jgi:hypothetical protein
LGKDINGKHEPWHRRRWLRVSVRRVRDHREQTAGA